MIRQILGMTCQIIVIHILCPVINFSHSLLHDIITPIIMDFFFLGFIYFLTIEKYFFALRDNTHTTSTKIDQFSRTPTLLSSYFQNSSTRLTVDVQFQINPPVLSVNSLILSSGFPLIFIYLAVANLVPRAI